MSDERIGPPPGIAVLPQAEPDRRWAFAGEFRGRTVLGLGYPSRAAAELAAWARFDDASDALADLDPRAGAGLRAGYLLRSDRWATMRADLLGQVLADAGSIRKAAKLLAVPRSTLGARARRYGSAQPRGERPPRMAAGYVVPGASWDRMVAGLLARIVDDAGSIRRAAKALDVPRSTLGAWVKREQC